jgi:hypothetical protein
MDRMSNTMKIAAPRQGELAQSPGDTPDNLPSLDALGAPDSLSRPQGKPALEMPVADGVKRPISDDPRHPVQSQEVAAYYSRTGNLTGLDTEAQAHAIANAMRSLKTEPGKPPNVLILETSGPAAGSYVEELRKSLPLALAMVPERERPELRFFISDGRPVLPARGESESPNDFANHLIALNKPPNQGRGLVDRDMSIANADRGVPNWANPRVVEYFIRERVEPAIALAKEFGVKQVVVDDHIGIPKDNKDSNPPVRSMSYFRAINGEDNKPLSRKEAVDLITGAYDQVLDRIRNAGLKTGLSSVTDPDGALAYGIDMNRLARKSDTIEIQAYRSDAQAVRKLTDKLYEEIASHFDRQYRDVDEFKFALVTRANKKDLSETTLIGQQKAIEDFEERVARLYRRNGEEPPKVTTSLWAHQNFYR